MADLFTKEQAPRLFAFIASGASIGTIAGASVTLILAERIGTLNLMLVAALILVAIIPLITILRSSVSDAAAGSNQESSISGNPFADSGNLSSTLTCLESRFLSFSTHSSDHSRISK